MKLNIILGVCGGIAAYKSVELLRLLKKENNNIRVVMTRNAQEFIGHLTFEALSNNAVCLDLFEKNENISVRHIDWATEANLVIIAPATANIIGKHANGIADDALSTILLAAKCPIIYCPSMNSNMYENKIVQKNLEILKSHGCFIISPQDGELACGVSGKGRLPEPLDILNEIKYILSPKDFKNKKILITAGPTREFIDPVRFISNASSGKMGYAIAQMASNRGAEVILISGPSSLPVPKNINFIKINSAQEMANKVFEHFDKIDIVIKAAAVGDYKPKQEFSQKIKKEAENNFEKILILEKNIDILKELGKRKKHQILIGFAAETQDLKQNALSKIKSKNLDLIIGNIVGKALNSGFEADLNKASLFYKDGQIEDLELMPKIKLANIILDKIWTMLFCQ